MTRQEHLDWCKGRARWYLDHGNVADAIASMSSDLGKHDDTKAIGKKLMPLALMYAMNNDAAGARRFIEGFR